MSTQPNTEQSALAAPLSSAGPEFEKGFTFEHILISVTIAHTREIGQFDDTCAGHITRGMDGYQGVLMTQAEPLYKNCTIEPHVNGCDCGLCQQVRRNTD